MRAVYTLCIFLLLLAPVSAEFYRYVDENGVVHFTDNLANVPEAQRKEGNRFKEVNDQGVGSVEQTPKETTEKQAEPAASQPEKKGLPQEIEALSELKRLNREKQVLDKEYEQLVTKKQVLKKDREKVTDAQGASAWEARLKALNNEIRDFEARRQIYIKKVKAFNARAVP